MNRIVTHVRHNVVAYLALFVALGGTSYAAASLPRNSVGAPQLRNHSITEVKLNEKSIAASVKAWVKLQWRGSRIVAAAASSPVRVGEVPDYVVVQWRGRAFSNRCVASATPKPDRAAVSSSASVAVNFVPASRGGGYVQLFGFGVGGAPVAQAADVVIFCP